MPPITTSELGMNPANGWSRVWRTRRGFDSLVQMSTGIAQEGMRTLGKDQPAPLPVQAIDHATGYLLAAATLRGLTERARTSRGFEARASLARMAQSLIGGPRRDGSGDLGVRLGSSPPGW
jgi:crotonobetainyl-CoA:carnitine CoA-transferase CaiB-like acyl-CoA transferase